MIEKLTVALLAVISVSQVVLAQDAKPAAPKGQDNSQTAITPGRQFETLVKEYEAARHLKDYKALCEAYEKPDNADSRKTPKDQLDKARETFRQQTEKCAAGCLKLAQKYTDDPAALDALLWVVGHTATGAPALPENAALVRDRGRALDLLRRDHLRSEGLGAFCRLRGVGIIQDPESVNFLEEVLDKSPHRAVQARALQRLADYKLSYTSAWLAPLRKDPAVAQLFERRWGKELLKKMLEADPDAMRREGERLYERLAKEFLDVPEPQAGTMGKLAALKLAALREPPAVGRPAPEVEGADIEGHELKLGDHRGKAVLLVFTGNWCAACAEFHPQQRSVAKKFAGRPLALLDVNSDLSLANRKKVNAKEQITWQAVQYTDAEGAPGPIATRWGIREWPTLFLIDSKGVIRQRYVGSPDEKILAEELDKLIRETETGRKGEVKPDPEAQKLVRQLGSQAFAEREAADKALAGMGARAVAAVRAGMGDPDPETARRCAALWPRLWQTEIARKDADRLAGYAHPLWERFRKAAGDDAGSRALFAEMAADFDRFRRLEAVEADPDKAGAAYAAELKQRDEALERGRQEAAKAVGNRDGFIVPNRGIPTRVESVTLLFLGAYPATASDENTRDLPHIVFMHGVVTGDSRAFRRLYAAWLGTRTDPHPIAIGMRLAVRNGFAEVFPTAVAHAANDKLAPRARGFALLGVGRFGSAADLPLLEKAFADARVFHTTFCPGKQNPVEVQVSDTAVVAALRLAGQHPADFGFTFLEMYKKRGPDEQAKFFLEMYRDRGPEAFTEHFLLGFFDDTARQVAHKKAREWLDKHGDGPKGESDGVKLPDDQGINRAAPAKEPVYQSNSPLYCLLVAGPNAEQRFWLVLDGKTLYVDRQGNGDLAKGLKLRPRQDIVATDGSEEFVLGALPARGAKPQFSNVLFSFKPAAEKKGVSFRIGTDDPRFLPENRPRPISVPLAAGLLSKRPQEAPVIWLDGPRHMILETSAETTLVPGKELQLCVSVGTYLSKESGRKLLYWEVPAGVHPTVEIEFPAKKGAPPIKSTFALKERGCLFHGPVRVPAEAGDGQARIVMWFAEWQEGRVASRSGWLKVAAQAPPAK
jgi:peroxiredoxin